MPKRIPGTRAYRRAVQRVQKLAEEATPLRPPGSHAAYPPKWLGRPQGRPPKPQPRPVGGNQAGYWVRRIARDRPDILARMQAGEFCSVRDAVRAAGLLKNTTHNAIKKET